MPIAGSFGISVWLGVVLAVARSTTGQELIRLDTVGHQAVSVSEDGKVVTVRNLTTVVGMRWVDGVATPLGTLGGCCSVPTAASASGTVIVGNSVLADGTGRAFRWEDGAMEDLGALAGAGTETWSSEAYGVSANGRVIVGHAQRYEPPPVNKNLFPAVRWVDGAIQELGTFGGDFGQGLGVSADGSVVVGWAHDASGERRAFRWEGAMTDLGDFGGVAAEAKAVSADGKVVVGRALDASLNFHPFRWTAAEGMQDLGTFNFFQPRDIRPQYVNADGTVVVGFAGTSSARAWIWTEEGGMEDLTPLVQAALPANKRVGQALFVTADGMTIAGAGFPSPEEAWVVKLCSDDDGDGLCNEWEIEGIDLDGDGTPELDLPARGADPMHKDLFIEVDAMNGFAPSLVALEAVVVAFDNAPVDNPDGTTGIVLHYQRDEMNLPAAPWPDRWPSFDLIKQNHFGTPTEDERNHPNWEMIRKAKRKVYRYCLFAQQHSAGAHTGFAEGPGDDLAITLGHPDTQAALARPFYAARRNDVVAGTLMHELGHTLGLHHGGGDGINNKPNYHSVMNYTWQVPFRNYAASWILDYSRDAFQTLDESNLDETVGIGGHPGHEVPAGPPAVAGPVSENGPVDWNADMDADDAGVAADVNYLVEDANGDGVVDASDPSPGQVLTGFDDWDNLKLSERGPNWTDGVHTLYLGGATIEEITALQIEEIGRVGGLAGDFSGDGVVDLADYAAFPDCLAGPGMTPAPTPPTTVQQCLDAFDFDLDADVDLLDWSGMAAEIPAG